MTGRAQVGPDRADSPAQAWMRAIEKTASIARRPERTLPAIIAERAVAQGDAPALLSDDECMTYAELDGRANQYARWALALGLEKGDCIGLLMPNRPEFLAIWLGITRVGGVVALLNTNLTGTSLAHCIDVVAPKYLIADAQLVDQLVTALPLLAASPGVWIHGPNPSFPRLDSEIEHIGAQSLGEGERGRPTIEDRALYIYTSGTTGLPKAAAVSHARLMQWSHWFAGMMDTQPTDRMFDSLPMYHSVGGVQAPGAVLVCGGSVVLSRKFSARNFWSDVVRWECTMFQYIGELCRYLLHTDHSAHETAHRIRIACGNGLQADIWNEFKNRFRIPRILEFYAATEGNVSFFNVEGEPGAVGRIPSYLAHRFPAALVKFDIDKGEPVRDELGFCVRCASNEVGEAVGQLLKDPANIGGRFEGYTNQEASEKKILRGVFQPGDAWFRTGDLMRRDQRGFFYFVDRIGDTFRWKGENVATSEVSAVLCSFPGIKEATVYGVAVPGADGRAGMAALVSDTELDLAALRSHLTSSLPPYACPMFLRIRSRMEVTATFKYTKTDLAREAFNPAATPDPIYFNDPQQQRFVRLNPVLYQHIQNGLIATPQHSAMDRHDSPQLESVRLEVNGV